ncbi:MAG: sodium:proton antiporter, partial [Acidobacteriota bacterium]
MRRIAVWTGLLFLPTLSLASDGVEEVHVGLGATLSPLWVAFFCLMLLAIAILPLKAEHWWENNLHKFWVSLGLGIPVFVLYFRLSPSSLLHSATEYFSFMVLLTSLYVVSGGILLRGDLRATPLTNTAFLAIGALIASFVGTT